MRKKSPKTHLGGMAPDEAPARGRPGSIGAPPPKAPRFYGRADQGNAVFSVRRWGKPTHGAPLSAAASLAVVERRPDPRDTPSHSMVLARRSTDRAFASKPSTMERQRKEMLRVSWLRAPVNRSTHRRTSQRFSLDFKNRFFGRIQKKRFLVNTFGACKRGRLRRSPLAFFRLKW